MKSSQQMQQVKAEAKTIFDPAVVNQQALGDGTTRYSKDNIDSWLSNWHRFSQEADHRIAWALAQADIEQAIASVDEPRIAGIFEFYCLLGYDLEEIAIITEAVISTVRRDYYRMRRLIIDTLCNNEIRYREAVGMSMPTGRYFGSVDNEPVFGMAYRK